MRRSRKVNALTFSRLCVLLQEGTRTCTELAEDTGLHLYTVYDWVAILHAHKLIHVCMWDGEGRNAAKVFKFGAAPDAPRPTKPRAQIHAEYRARKRNAALLHSMAGKLKDLHGHTNC